MKVPSHLTDEQIARYRGRMLAPADLLDADDHLAGCVACRHRLARAHHWTAEAEHLRTKLSAHLPYDAVVACAEGRETPEAGRHVAECDLCAGEVADLRAFQNELRERPRAPLEIRGGKPVDPRWRFRISGKWIAVAAAVALAAEIGFWTWLHRRVSPAPLAANATAALQASLPPFERAPLLDRLISPPGALLGAPGAGPQFELTGPLGTAVLDDRPVFRWKPLAAGATYVVAVFDEAFQKVAESPALETTAWQPDRPLPRGVVLNWQVTARSGGATVHAPLPPAPEARLEVLPAADAGAIEATRRARPGDHLGLAALLVKAGALDDAAAQLDQADPQAAEPYRQQLRKLRATP